MPILDIQKAMRQLGRIRMGNQVPTQNGKTRPAKLSTWRLTSPSQELLDAAADLYGGEVKPWEGAPSEGQQFELYTEADTLDIILPPGDMALSQYYELWSGGGCARRCDGETEMLSGDACSCPVDPEQRQELANKGQACKPTTRLRIVLPRVPDIGLWRLETHGWYAAVELAGTVEIMQRLSSVTGAMVPAHLRIDQRTSKKAGETRHYTVPVIELRGVSAATLLTGEMPAGSLTAGEQPALPAAGPSPTAGAAPPVEPPGGGLGGSTGPFHRNIASAATKAALDPAALDALVAATLPGRARLAEVAGPEEANKVLDAIRALRTGSKTPAQTSGEKPTSNQLGRIHGELRRQGVAEDAKHARLSEILGRPVGSFDELTRNDAKVILDTLAAGPFDDPQAKAS